MLMHRVIRVNQHLCFHVALFTTYETLRSYHDGHATRREIEQGRLTRGVLPKNGTSTIKALLGRNISVVFEQLSKSPIAGTACSFDHSRGLIACFGKGMPAWALRSKGASLIPQNRKPSFEFRVANGLHAMSSKGLLKKYNYSKILALRPDASLSRSVELEKTCSRYPGVNLIGSSITRVIRGYMHDRDLDLAYLACDVVGLQTYLYPYLDNNATTRSASKFRKAYRLQPRAFNKNLTEADCKPLYGLSRFECSSIALMAERGIRLGTLDKAHVFIDLLNHPVWCFYDWASSSVQPTSRRWHDDLHCQMNSTLAPREVRRNGSATRGTVWQQGGGTIWQPGGQSTVNRSRQSTTENR